MCLNQIIINKANFSKNSNHSYDNQISLGFFAIEKNRLDDFKSFMKCNVLVSSFIFEQNISDFRIMSCMHDLNIHGIMEEKPVGAVLMKGAAIWTRCTSSFCECLYSYDGELEKIYE